MVCSDGTIQPLRQNDNREEVSTVTAGLRLSVPNNPHPILTRIGVVLHIKIVLR
jgi:hypothetical protein